MFSLASFGQSVWLDSLVDLDHVIRDYGVSGATTNPTILEQEINPRGDHLLALVRRACDRFAGVHRVTHGLDGWVSFELDPALAHDASATVEAALRLRATVRRPNLYVKIPATEAGVEAFEEAVALGVPVNVTLLFSRTRHRAVAEAYVRGLDRFAARGGRPGTLPSVASFFVSRVDTETDARLAARGAGGAGRLAIANAKLAYRSAREVFSGPAWRLLAAHGAHPQRCLWASTSTKDPRYRDVRYVEELIGPDTVTTLPLKTLKAFADHGIAAGTLEQGWDEAEHVFDDIAAAGLDYDDITRTLEVDGLRRFADSWRAVERELGADEGSAAGRALDPQEAAECRHPILQA